ncbi:chemotaxis protein [Halobacteriales archaeon QS_1_68_20]|nr:MAG: chemotaxis protein [Halobacteriales archaeon QS_1_68_20]
MAAEATEGTERQEPTVRVVEFTLGGERFAVHVTDVDNIEDPEGVTRIPRTGEAIEGVMDLRGEITAIIDPRVHLDVDAEPTTEEQQVLVLDQSKDKQKLGFRVDRIHGVENYPESAVEDTEDFPELDSTGVQRQAIRAIIRGPSEESDFEPIGLVDADEIVRLSRQGRGAGR